MKLSNKVIWHIVVRVLFITVMVWAPYTASASIGEKIDGYLTDPALKGGIQGVLVRSLKDDRVVYERNADMNFLPASNQKLITSAAALSLLGANYHYNTNVYAGGKVDGRGVLHGCLYLVGAGDPLLSTEDLASLVEQIARKGIKRVDGAVVYDDSGFDRVRYGDSWCWDDMNWYYSAQISALNLNENMVTVVTQPAAKAGDPVKVTVEPAGNNVELVVTATTAPKGGGNDLAIRRDLGINRIRITGSVATDAKPDPDRITVENPSLYAASVFTQLLKKAGIKVAKPATEGQLNAPTGELLAVHQSDPLSVIIAKLNKPSDNLVAECLLKTLGHEKGKAGSAQQGISVVDSWLKSIGVAAGSVNMSDGSGLARTNYVTPRAFVTILTAMRRRPDGAIYENSLPIAGVDGTLRNRMKSTPAEGKCHAKSGYVSNVSSLSGYVPDKTGDVLVFSIIMNNHLCTNRDAMRVQDEIITMLAQTDTRSQAVSVP